jgi:hypothetical protein
MSFLRYRLQLILILLLPLVVFSQNSSRNQRAEKTWDTQVIDQYFKKNPLKKHTDSMFYQAYQYVNYGITKDTTDMQFGDFVRFIEQNKPAQAIATLKTFSDTIFAENQRYHNQLCKAREYKRLKAIADTAEVSSLDIYLKYYRGLCGRGN